MFFCHHKKLSALGARKGTVGWDSKSPNPRREDLLPADPQGSSRCLRVPAHLYGLLGWVVLQGQQLGCVLEGAEDILLLFQFCRQLLHEEHKQSPNLGYGEPPHSEHVSN